MPQDEGAPPICLLVPRCGKTHAVRAAAAAAGLRLIAVSGPEVLNKYIGASEAAVRELFRCVSRASIDIRLVA